MVKKIILGLVLVIAIFLGYVYIGDDGQVGSGLQFEGNKDAGSGKFELLKLIPNESVEIKLTMTEPFKSESMIHYQLAQQAEGTLFTWSMSGETGIANLKAIVEK